MQGVLDSLGIKVPPLRVAVALQDNFLSVRAMAEQRCCRQQYRHHRHGEAYGFLSRVLGVLRAFLQFFRVHRISPRFRTIAVRFLAVTNAGYETFNADARSAVSSVAS